MTEADGCPMPACQNLSATENGPDSAKSNPHARWRGADTDLLARSGTTTGLWTGGMG
jgi:hypothetical protein